MQKNNAAARIVVDEYTAQGKKNTHPHTRSRQTFDVGGDEAISETSLEHTDHKDYFITRNGKIYAGTHLIIDLWDATSLDDLELMETTLRQAIDVAKATLLHIHLHHFTPNGGISGVAVLAESHISVHTWPEKGFAAFDVFMCGESEPEKAIDVLKAAFKPKRTIVDTYYRGDADRHE